MRDVFRSDFTDEDVVLAVKRGAYWLDENHPDWVKRIDLSLLDMNHCDRCVIGQAMGNYYDGLDAIFPMTDDSVDDMETWAVEHGFQSPDFPNRENWDNRDRSNGMEMKYYSALETVWTDVVRERLG